MKFTSLPLEGAWLIELEPISDERGSFARAFCRQEFAEHGLMTEVAQSNLCRTSLRGTVRGMHFQAAPFAEAKLVRCSGGAVFDVMVDLREGSPTHRQWVGFELSEGNDTMLYVPEGFAHGYQTLEDDSVLFYQVSQCYSPEHERGVRWDDPVFGIRWPIEVTRVSAKDRAYQDYEAGA